jgi:hypothetical protein
VIGLSDEDEQKVGDYIDQMGLTLRIGSGSKASGRYGVAGIPSSALIDPQGKVVWTGHPSSLSDATLQAALKGARPRSASMFALPPPKELAGRLASVGKSMEAGKLGAALKAASAAAEDAKASDAEREDAQAAVAAITEHVDLLREQGEAFAKSLDVVRALLVFDGIAGEMSGTPAGDAAKARAAEIRKDPMLSKELAAAEAFERTKASAAKLASSKARAKWEDFAKKYEGTRAGDRAKALSRATAK